MEERLKYFIVMLLKTMRVLHRKNISNLNLNVDNVYVDREDFRLKFIDHGFLKQIEKGKPDAASDIN